MRLRSVVLSLSLLTGFATAAAAAPFDFPSYAAAFTFTEAGTLQQTTIGVAFDGNRYWSTSGGGAGGIRLAQYNPAGALLNTYSPGLDFRSIFTDASGNVFAREFADNTIYAQTSPGVFAPHVTLAGATLDAQSSVVFNGAFSEYVALSSAAVQRWDLAGNYLGATTLIGFGSMFGENVYPQNRGLAVLGGYYLTYSNGNVSAWDSGGNRTDTAQLLGVGTTFDSHFSLSYANGMVFVIDDARGIWRGYDVGGQAVPVPEPATLTLLGAGLLVARARARRRSA